MPVAAMVDRHARWVCRVSGGGLVDDRLDLSGSHCGLSALYSSEAASQVFGGK